MKAKLRHFLATTQCRFIVVGGLNTLIGYFISLFVYTMLSETLHTILIAIINAILTITLSFISQRTLVFRSTQPWLPEYLRMYMVNAVSTCANIASLWFAVDIIHMPFWLAQGIITILLALYMYFAHRHFTFKKR